MTSPFEDFKAAKRALGPLTLPPILIRACSHLPTTKEQFRFPRQRKRSKRRQRLVEKKWRKNPSK